MPNRNKSTYRPPMDDDDDPTAPEPTARPTERLDLSEEDGDRLVPLANVGGAAPTPLGGDSGGDLPGAGDDLSNLAEPEPPEDPPEVGAMHVRHGDMGKPRRRS